MTRLSELTALRDRVIAATGPDRELDAALYTIVYFPEYSADDAGAQAAIRVNLEYRPPPCYTASVDAALALCERMLPGWARGFDAGSKTIIAFVDPHDFEDRFSGARYTATGAAEPLAILAAILNALIAKETSNADNAKA